MKNIKLRNVESQDALMLRQVAKNNPPLEEHTPYTYWVMCNYQKDCSFILTVDNIFAGYILCVQNDETIFIWQICILPQFQGQRFSQTLIDKVISIAKTKNKNIQMTILDSNKSSIAAFTSACIRNNAKFKRVRCFEQDDTLSESVYQIDLT